MQNNILHTLQRKKRVPAPDWPVWNPDLFPLEKVGFETKDVTMFWLMMALHCSTYLHEFAGRMRHKTIANSFLKIFQTT